MWNDHVKAEPTSGLSDLQKDSLLIFQVDILFSLSDRLHNSKTLIYSDLQSLAPQQYMKQVMLFPSNNLQGDEARGRHKAGRSARGQELDDRDAGVQLQVVQHAVAILGPRFFIGSLSGVAGAAAVYPVDLVKTRIMNQRSQ